MAVARDAAERSERDAMTERPCVSCPFCHRPMAEAPGILTHVCLDERCRGALDWDGYKVHWTTPPDAVLHAS